MAIDLFRGSLTLLLYHVHTSSKHMSSCSASAAGMSIRILDNYKISISGGVISSWKESFHP